MPHIWVTSHNKLLFTYLMGYEGFPFCDRWASHLNSLTKPEVWKDSFTSVMLQCTAVIGWKSINSSHGIPLYCKELKCILQRKREVISTGNILLNLLKSPVLASKLYFSSNPRITLILRDIPDVRYNWNFFRLSRSSIGDLRFLEKYRILDMYGNLRSSSVWMFLQRQ